ncbi:hypothetical protein [Streptomyces sp. NPDC059883]|uniref:hypothetical protein n=1 Tax=unclassified Streptomyces TaxID=2593676 RepID=UPI0036679247
MTSLAEAAGARRAFPGQPGPAIIGAEIAAQLLSSVPRLRALRNHLADTEARP